MTPQQEVYAGLLDSSGNLDESKVKAYIEDTLNLQKEVSTVYESITKGLLSKCHYPAKTVLGIVAGLQKEVVDKKTVKEDMLNLLPDSGYRDLVREYFGNN